MYLALAVPYSAPALAERPRFARLVATPVVHKILNYVKPKTDDDAVAIITAVVHYITREKTFRETVCKFVDSIEERSEVKRLIVCDYDIIVRLKLAVLHCLKFRINDVMNARTVFADYGLHRDDASIMSTIRMPRFSGFPKTRLRIASIVIPTPKEVSKRAHELIFANDATVRRSIRSLIRKKLTFISNNYNVSVRDLEMDVLSASLEGYYLSIPFADSDQHVKASAVATAKNKINKMISYYQTQKRRQISRDETTGVFTNSMVSLSQQNPDGSEIGDSIIFHNHDDGYEQEHAAFEMRTSLERLNVREPDQTRRIALNLIRGRNYARFKKEQEKKRNCRFSGYEDLIDDLGVRKYLNEVRLFVGMSRQQWNSMLEDIRAA